MGSHFSARRAVQRFVRIGILLIPTLLLAHAVSAGTLRCNGKLIQAGDAKARLVAACGEPVSREVIAVVRSFEDGTLRQASHAEEWSYESAGIDGYRVLRFERGRLVGEGMRCSGRLVGAGDTTAAVRERCGEPLSRDPVGLVYDSPGPASRAVSSESLVEQWVYDLGPGSLRRIVEVRGGRIERIEEGARP